MHTITKAVFLPRRSFRRKRYVATNAHVAFLALPGELRDGMYRHLLTIPMLNRRPNKPRKIVLWDYNYPWLRYKDREFLPTEILRQLANISGSSSDPATRKYHSLVPLSKGVSPSLSFQQSPIRAVAAYNTASHCLSHGMFKSEESRSFTCESHQPTYPLQTLRFLSRRL